MPPEFTIALTVPSVTHVFAVGVEEGSAYCRRPILFTAYSANQRSPSGPAVMSCGPAAPSRDGELRDSTASGYAPYLVRSRSLLGKPEVPVRPRSDTGGPGDAGRDGVLRDCRGTCG